MGPICAKPAHADSVKPWVGHFKEIRLADKLQALPAGQLHELGEKKGLVEFREFIVEYMAGLVFQDALQFRLHPKLVFVPGGL